MGTEGPVDVIVRPEYMQPFEECLHGDSQRVRHRRIAEESPKQKQRSATAGASGGRGRRLHIIKRCPGYRKPLEQSAVRSRE